MRAPYLVLVATALALPAQAAVEVTFTGAEHYTDGTLSDSSSARSRAETQDALRKMFTKLGDRYLAAGETLTVDVTALDLAGRFEPWRTPLTDTRFMNAVTWPSMTFGYRLEDKGAVVAEGVAKLADMDYLTKANIYPDGDGLRYERQMLADWFARGLKAARR